MILQEILSCYQKVQQQQQRYFHIVIQTIFTFNKEYLNLKKNWKSYVHIIESGTEEFELPPEQMIIIQQIIKKAEKREI